ncbi:NUDIX domain-containing protein [Pontivivens insulae]|uniref:Nudix hydrolase domain-containing protein n=1 Tax=Pontivivens insulae TaxID=1639689 RepID=A0A2R8A6F6_9RHOB|nr:NUDIX hydrolase [Pontivivens insulae]RED17920.1 ADP-ribose pyrophosphatase YjhB (NUDIX family) [Pontivivens insulae]SPF27809.1 hypothetical protein POI8812_00104 [Pontivivens insulae]
MSQTTPRLAARALILDAGRLLLVNAYPGAQSDLMCLPGGGVEKHQSVPDNLIREVWEETGLTIRIGALRAVSEFHHPEKGFHQVELIYEASIIARPKGNWADTEGVVNRTAWVNQTEFAGLRVKPDIVEKLAFGPKGDVLYDPLEVIVP